MERTRLGQQDAVLLAHALVARLADQVGARVLFIKGPTAVALGARPPRPSSDVDVLVESGSGDRLAAAMAAAGWVNRLRPGSFVHTDDLAFDHSLHLIHPDWPCDVDVHFAFPGFLRPMNEVFELLWSRRTMVQIAGRQICSPDFVGQALVVGLHACRDPEAPSSRQDLAHLVTEVSRRGQAQCLARLARDTGAAHPVAELLIALDVPMTPVEEPERERLEDWRRHQRRDGLTDVWLSDLVAARWRDKPTVLRRALFPSRDYLTGSSLIAPTPTQMAELWVHRIARGVRHLPSALAAVRATGAKRR